ncbi:kinase-like domain-containing protein [Aspergillus lucknowensis]|uniref:Kinase-like domain-containing protein n=1 Tax=Aspergillus lucknowensis TaxID=176173 RepID=A0ABR4LK01_9EURO
MSMPTLHVARLSRRVSISSLRSRILPSVPRQFPVMFGFLRSLRTFPRSNLTISAPILRAGREVEEETLPDYDPDEFYPVHIGDVFKERYRVLGKLGFGASSTTWFCRDLRNHCYVALKVYVRSPLAQAQINREVEAYKHLATVQSSHVGQRFIRHVLDSFELERPDRTYHHCLVHEPLQTTLYDFQRLGGNTKALPEDLVRGALRHLLQALDFLHADANITHCDLKESNIMLTVEDEGVLEDFEKAEKEDPSPRKMINDERSIYATRNFRHPRNNAWGYPVLCDFGEARIGPRHSHEWIQPEVYRAPEIILELDWSHSVDIWNAGCLVWDMLEQKHLFKGEDEEGYTNRYHIAEMVAYLGSPPLEFQRRSGRSPLVFTEDGHWKGNPPLPPITFENTEEKLYGASKIAFLKFLRSMLAWVPDERKSARELLEDPWLQG